MSECRSKYALTEELQEVADLSEAAGEIKLGSFHTYDDAGDLM